MQTTGGHDTSHTAGMDDYRDNCSGDSRPKVAASMRQQKEKPIPTSETGFPSSSVDSSFPNTFPIRTVGMRMTLRSTLAPSSAAHTNCRYVGNPATVNRNGSEEDATSVDIADPLEQQLLLVKQCLRDCREVLLLARECAVHASTSLTEGHKDDGDGGGSGNGERGCSVYLNQEGVAVRLLRAVIAFEEEHGQKRGQAPATAPPTANTANGSEAEKHSAVDVRGQVLCLLSEMSADERRGAQSQLRHRDGSCERAKEGEGGEDEKVNALDREPGEISDESSGTVDGEQSSYTDALPSFLRFRQLFTNECAYVRSGGVPPLLSEHIRYAPLIEDMCTLARHLLLPLDVVRHHQRLWLFTNEDVKYTLEEQLYHCRVAVSGVRAGMPAHQVAQLWTEAWELLGAVWRQRGRLFGAYSAAIPPAVVAAQSLARHRNASSTASCAARESAGAMILTSAKSLPPFLLPDLASSSGSGRSTMLVGEAAGEGKGKDVPFSASQAAQTLSSSTARIIATPPSVDASPFHKERYARHVSRFWRAQANEYLTLENIRRRACAGEGGDPSVSQHRERPDLLQAQRAGTQPLFGTQVYDTDDSLSIGPFSPTKIGVVLSRDASSIATTESANEGAHSGCRYVVRDPLDSLWRALRCCHATARTTTAAQRSGLLTCTPFFDVAMEDVTASAAVPYLSPEVYTELCQRRQQKLPVKLPVHSFSDDAWSLAVVVLEAALSGFDVNASQFGAATEGCPMSSSVFADTLVVLGTVYHLPVEAAQNFLYAALFHFTRLVAANGHEEEEGEGNSMATEEAVSATRPSPVRLAAAWKQHLANSYGSPFFNDLVRPLCANGLCWRREDRWLAFCHAHAPSAAAAVPATPPITAPNITTVNGGDSAAQLTMQTAASSQTNEPVTPTTPGSAIRTVAAVLHGAPSTTSLDGLAVAAASDLGVAALRADSTLATPLTSAMRTAAQGAGKSPRRAGQQQQPSPSAVSVNAHSQKLQDRSEKQLDLLRVPLLPVLPVPINTGGGVVSSAEARKGGDGRDAEEKAQWPAAELWRRFSRWRCVVERAAIHSSGSHGAVGPQRQSLLFTEMIRLGREAIMLSHDDSGRAMAHVGLGEAQVRPLSRPRQTNVRYAVAEHPFIRGVVERGQFPAYASLVPCPLPSTCVPGVSSSSSVSQTAYRPPQPLSTPSLFIPLSSLQTLFARAEKDAVVALDSSSPLSSPLLRMPHSQPPSAYTVDCQSPRPASLQVLLGGTKRLRSQASVAAAADVRRCGGSWQAPPPATLTLTRAAWGLTREIDVNVALQLSIVARLRALLLASSSPTPFAAMAEEASARSVAASVRAYLMQLQEEMQVCLVPLPATIRGEVWGALLEVPAPRKREALYAGLGPVHRTDTDRQIAVDTPRCHPYHPLLSTEAGQEKLQRVLKAWLCMPRKAPLSYWQGLDSVCAVLLTVSYTDEALVLAELDAVVRLYVAHKDTDAAAGTTKTDRRTPRENSVTAAGEKSCLPPISLLGSRGGAAPSSMESALHRFGVTLRYCDPLLATHIFRLDCPPQLFAISWLLTLFAHSLPAHQVCLLWDFLFLYAHDYPHCLLCMCCAFLMQKRASIMGQDASGVLAALGNSGSGDAGGSGGGRHSSGPSHGSARKVVDVVAVLADTAALMRAVPPCIGCQPDAGEGEGGDGEMTHHAGGATTWQSAVRASEVAFMDVSTLLSAFAASRASKAAAAVHRRGDSGGKAADVEELKTTFWHSGLYLVDVRDGGERVLGALQLPLADHASSSLFTAREADSADADEARWPRDNTAAAFATEDTGEGSNDVGRLSLVERRAAALDRSVSEVAAEVVRQLRNPMMAALLPTTAVGTSTAAHAPLSAKPSPSPPPLDRSSSTHAAVADEAPSALLDRRPDPSPLVMKTSQSPHVVLLASGWGRLEEEEVGQTETATGARSDARFGAPSVPYRDGVSFSVVQSLALELMRCGVHNVSILLGGVELLKQHAPWMMVPGGAQRDC